MDFDTFSRRAERIVAGIPPEYLAGVVGVEAHPERRAHPHIPRYYTLGECADDEVTRLTDPEEMKSRIHLYHGSFAAVARGDPDFDWEGELRETILHEIRHHLEDRAGIRDLLDEDAEAEALAAFYADREMPGAWYRAGEELEPALFRVADDLFLELLVREPELRDLTGNPLELIVLDEPLKLDVPADVERDEILTFDGEGLERGDGSAGNLHVILRVV